MKRVLLLRHGKSSWSEPDLDDHDRPLAARGMKDARRVAAFLGRQQGEGLRVDLVLCSSALRARQTWAQLEKLVEPRFGVRIARELYLPTRDGLLRCLQQAPARAHSVLVVGHNPSLEALALMLAQTGDASLRAHLLEKFPTGALCIIELDQGGLKGRLSAFVTPHDLKSGERSSREPSKAGSIELDRKPRWSETALRVFEATGSQVRENVAGARQGEDPEFVHQMRVGVRRLRTALAFFRGVLPEQTSEKLRSDLRWLFGLLGPLREYDVVLTNVLSPLDATTGLTELRQSVHVQRQELQGKLKVALGSARFERLVSTLLEQQAELARHEGAPKLKSPARKGLNKRLRKVLRLEGAVEDWFTSGASADPRSADVLHLLRKELKKLRYACDFVQQAFSQRATQRYLRRLTALQDVLGQLQDNQASERLLTRHVRLVPGRELRANLRAHVQAPLDAATIRAGSELPELWQAFKRAEPFWL